MGQRLNIEIKYRGTVMANAYYHWSAYTSSSIELTKKIIDSLIQDETTPTVVGHTHVETPDGKTKMESYTIGDLTIKEKAIYYLSKTGAGFSDHEFASIIRDARNGKLPAIRDELYVSSKNRNEGLLAITQEGISDTEMWEEGRVSIDIEKRKVDFDVVWSMSDEDYEEYVKEDVDAGRSKPKEVNLKYNLYDMTYEQFIDFAKIYETADDSRVIFISADGTKNISIE